MKISDQQVIPRRVLLSEDLVEHYFAASGAPCLCSECKLSWLLCDCPVSYRAQSIDCVQGNLFEVGGQGIDLS